MNKTEAIRLLGGTVGEAAQEVGISVQAVYRWPDVLPDRIADRVQAALWRREQRLQAAQAQPAPGQIGAAAAA